jgi:hypothetical protein
VAGDTLELGFVSSLALQTLTVEYFGQSYVYSRPFAPACAADIAWFGFCSAHAGYAPWEGVNALDAAFVAYAGISALRQQIRPEQRVHGVISGRDWTPNGSFPLTPLSIDITVESSCYLLTPGIKSFFNLILNEGRLEAGGRKYERC